MRPNADRKTNLPNNICRNYDIPGARKTAVFPVPIDKLTHTENYLLVNEKEKALVEFAYYLADKLKTQPDQKPKELDVYGFI